MRWRERFQRWALRGHHHETGRITLEQRRIYVLPTRAGLAYATMLSLMLSGAMNYNLNLGYALVFLLAALGLLAILHTFRNLVHLQLEAGRAAPVFAGEPARFTLHLINQRHEPRHDITLAPLLDEPSPASPVTLSLPAQAQTSADLELISQQRGWLTLPRIKLSTTYPLGLVRTWSYCAPSMRCLIYPTPATAAPAWPLAPAEQGQQQPQSPGQDDFAGLRPHQAADNLRHIAWKAAARQPHAPLQAKQFSAQAAQTLWLDWQQLPPHLDTEQRLSLLCRWLCDAEAAGLRWGLRLPDSELPAAQGPAHLQAGLARLALFGLPHEA